MPRHSLFPNSITYHYTTNGHPHNMTLPVGVVAGSAPGWTLPTRDGGTVDWRTAVDAFAALLAEVMNTGDSIDYAELFTYEATNSPAEFLASHPIDIAGGSASAPVEFAQAVLPFKAIGGTSFRLTLLEFIMAIDEKRSYAGLDSAELTAIVDFILSDDDWIITRGGTFPLVSLGMTTKINDKLRKHFLLDA